MKNNVLILAAIILLGVTACTDQESEIYAFPEQEMIAFSGLMTRVDVTYPEKEYKLSITAQLDNATDYINEATAVFAADGTITFDENKQFYYPLNNNNLHFFAHSGERVEGNNILLIAGQVKETSDALLSNGWDGSSLTAATGTVGSFWNPLEKLIFRHVMTFLEVIVESDNAAANNNLNPSQNNVQFQCNEGYAQGTLPLTATNNTATKKGDEKYTIQNGINYLVPTGGTIANMSSLVIGDYTATTDDLNNLTIAGVNGESLKLLPGKAYTLRFKIKDQKLQGVELTSNK